MINHEIEKYKELLTNFINNKISVEEFESSYLSMFKNETTIFLDEIFTVLDNLFSDVDSFCHEESLRDENDLNEIQLRESAQNALEKLK